MGQADEELLEAVGQVLQEEDGPHRSAVLSDVERVATRFAAQLKGQPGEDPTASAPWIRAACYGLVVDADLVEAGLRALGRS